MSAALGWLDLENAAEALAELEQISPALQQRPEVLEVRWLIQADRQDWPAALQVARALLEQAPKRASTWLHLAYALRRAPEGGLAAAQEALRPAAERFPKEPVIPFNLACYACQRGQPDEALDWLRRAMRVGGKEAIRAMALKDRDLEPLWTRIGAL